MIVGVGTDIVQISRIRNTWEKFGERFAKRILVTEEFAEFASKKQPEHFLAKRFAAKEATVKALGTGLSRGVSWHDIHIDHDSHGKPLLVFRGKAKIIADELNLGSTHISISDEQQYAVAFVILEAATKG